MAKGRWELNNVEPSLLQLEDVDMQSWCSGEKYRCMDDAFGAAMHKAGVLRRDPAPVAVDSVPRRFAP